MIENIVDGVRWIPGRDKFLPDSHMYVIGKPEAQDITLIDCGLMEMGGHKLEVLKRADIPFKHIKRIIMTHTHLDHIGCLPDILKALPDVEVWIHREEASYIERGDCSIVFGNDTFESMLLAQYPITKDFCKTKVHRYLEGGEELSLGGVEFKVLHLPGHSAGSIGLLNKEHKLFLSGDTIYADGAIGRYDLTSADPSALKKSLELIDSLNLDILLPCHNRVVTRGAGPMINKAVRQWAPLLGN